MPLTPTAEAIVAGNRRALAKAITLVESSRPQDREAAQALLNELLPHTGKSLRVGITGVPGVGKSTFIESFGQHVIAKGHKVAVLAVDPEFSYGWWLHSRRQNPHGAPFSRSICIHPSITRWEGVRRCSAQNARVYAAL